MKIKRSKLLAIAFFITMTNFTGLSHARSGEPVNVVATFSVLGDMVRQIGGNRINLTTLVGADSDAHVYQPTPADAQAVAEANLLIINGVGFEGWLERLIKASNYNNPVITATNGIALINVEEDESHHDEHEDHEKHEDEHDNKKDLHADHHHGDTDPHAWMSLANAKIYVNNITNGLISIDPKGERIYKRNAKHYLTKINALEKQIYNQVNSIPSNKRKVVTPHDAFGYLSAAYNIEFFAPVGFSTESEASAGDVAKLIRQIKNDNISAIFIENISDDRLISQIARETGIRIGGTLYADALAKHGPASTYLGMMQHNINTLLSALKKQYK